MFLSQLAKWLWGIHPDIAVHARGTCRACDRLRRLKGLYRECHYAQTALRSLQTDLAMMRSHLHYHRRDWFNPDAQMEDAPSA